MRGFRKFSQRGYNFDYFFFLFFFLVYDGREDPNTAIIDPPPKRHLNGVSLAGRLWPNIECWLGSFVALQGIRTSIAEKPYMFVIFQGGGHDILPPPLWTRTCYSLTFWKKFQGEVC